ncbi:two-component system histidine kinase PnpS [Amphibacillus xylanus]|uniref:two-component system histidine kinase PnpS n=1 Tax=Amphibacillus xylanus TaxID=1449 RepID=UPI00059C96C7|nr:ATP-binding protein [Amphibacillus xylanus]
MKRSSKFTFVIFVTILTVLFLSLLYVFVPLVQGSDRIIVVLALIGAHAVIFILIYQIYLTYLKPNEQIKVVLDELIKGNYSARAYEKSHHGIDRLGYAVNKLAFNLQNLNRQDKMHSRQLHTVIDNMESGIMLLDTQGYVQLINRKFTNLFDLTEQEVKNKLYYHVLTHDSIYQAVQDAFLYEDTIKNSITLTKGNAKIYIEIVAVPFFNESRELRGLVFVFHDISELKQVEQIRKDFVANVSHELKTPVTSIKGFAETMLDDDSIDPEMLRKFLTIIYKESDRLQSLIHDLLELSKLERDEFKINLNRINFSSIVRESVTIVKDMANKRNVELILDVNDDLNLTGDEQRLKQVILNLLYNAISYSKKDGKVHVSAYKNQQWLTLTVKDNGIGIPESLIGRIFERFYRVDQGRSRETGGTGLGLAIVKHIVEAHDGFIEVDSQYGVGSTFTINLPITHGLTN